MESSTAVNGWWLPKTTPSPASSPSLGLILPLCALLFLLIVVGVCFLWHFISGRRSKRARQRYEMSRLNSSFLSNLQRSMNQTQLTSSRSSSASVTPLRSVCELHGEKLPLPEYVPGRLSKISESPEDRLALNKGKRLIDDEINDSILSMISKWKAGMIPDVESQHHSNLSHDVSQSYPSLAVSAQAPFSPYHLTWLTPDHNGSLHSEPAMTQRDRVPIVGLAQRLNSLGSNSEDHRRHFSYSSWKSPYYPNHNTPVGSESDSCPAQFPLNHVSVDRPGGGNLHHDLSKLSSPHAVLYRIPTEPSLVMSCPGNIEAYQQSMSCELCRVHQHEMYQDNPLHSNHTSGDTSICPMMGSSGNNSAELMKPGMPYHSSSSGPLPTSQSTSLCAQVDSSQEHNKSGRPTESIVAASDQLTTLQGISSIEHVSSGIPGSSTEKDSSDQGFQYMHHSAPAAYGNFSSRLPMSPSLAETQQLALEAFILYNHVRNRSNTTNPEVFSSGSPCTDSSLPSISLSPFRVAALANLLDRSAFHSLPSDTDVFLWDASCEAAQEVPHGEPHMHSPPPPYTPPILSDVKHWL